MLQIIVMENLILKLVSTVLNLMVSPIGNHLNPKMSTVSMIQLINLVLSPSILPQTPFYINNNNLKMQHL